MRAFPALLAPHVQALRHRLRRRDPGDRVRGALFGGILVAVWGVLFWAASWLTQKLTGFAEFGDYLLRLGLSWLFLSCLAFLAFSGIVTSLSTFFLADDLRLMLATPVPSGRLYFARLARTLASASWMVLVFLAPLLAGIGYGYCAPAGYYVSAVLTVVPFAVVPITLGTAVTFLVVNVFPARRARDLLMLMGLVFAVALVLLMRFLRPERLLRVESLPDIADFFSTLQSPVTPLLPSFWAGEAVFASTQGGVDWLHHAALWSTAGAFLVLLGLVHRRWHFTGYSRSQESSRAETSSLSSVDRLAAWLPLSPIRRHLLVKDVKIFLRDVSQWVQLLPLLALVLLYLYNFSVLDLPRVTAMHAFIKNVYAFVNIGMAGFVVATVAVRFVFPAVSSEGAAFWLVRSSPVSMRDFLWSKFWTALVPVLVFSEGLTVAANALLGVDPFLRVVAIAAIALMTLALVGLATGLGARYPRFDADPTQAAGSYGGVLFMICAVLVIVVTVALMAWPSSVYLLARTRAFGTVMTGWRQAAMAACFAGAAVACLGTWWIGMQSGVRALEAMRR